MNPIQTEDQLIDDFSPQEVQVVRDLLAAQCRPLLPSTLRRIVLLALRGHYMSPENFGEDYAHLACYRFQEDAPKDFDVALSGLNDDRKPDQRGIYIGFGSINYSKAGMGDFAGISDDRSRTYLSKLTDVTLNIRHIIPNNPDDAFDMAEMTAMVLTAIAEPIIRGMSAMSLEVVSVAEPEKKNQAPQRDYAVVTSVKISYTSSVTRSVESHRLRRIALIVDSEGTD